MFGSGAIVSLCRLERRLGCRASSQFFLCVPQSALLQSLPQYYYYSKSKIIFTFKGKMLRTVSYHKTGLLQYRYCSSPACMGTSNCTRTRRTLRMVADRPQHRPSLPENTICFTMCLFISPDLEQADPSPVDITPPPRYVSRYVCSLVSVRT
jgi:hypothetical protein